MRPLTRDSAAHRLPVFCAVGNRACLSGYADLPLSLLTDVLEILRNAGWSAFLITLLDLTGSWMSPQPQGSDLPWRLSWRSTLYALP